MFRSLSVCGDLEGPRAPTIITTLSMRPSHRFWLAHRAFDEVGSNGMSRIADHRNDVNAPATSGRRQGASGAPATVPGRIRLLARRIPRHAPDPARHLRAGPRARAAAQGRGGPRGGTPALRGLRTDAAHRRGRPPLRARRRRVRAVPPAPPPAPRALA